MCAPETSELHIFKFILLLIGPLVVSQPPISVNDPSSRPRTTGSVGCVIQGQPFQIYDINMTHRVIYFGRAHTLQTPSDCGNSSRKLRRGMRKDVGFKIYCTTTTPRARFAAYNHCHHPSLHPQKRVVVATTIREILGTSTLLLLLLPGESEMTSKRATIALATLVYIISTHPPMLGKIYRINFGSICTALQSRVLL